jgi:hypothetical protein
MGDTMMLFAAAWWAVIFYLLYKEFWRTFKWLLMMGGLFLLGLAMMPFSPVIGTVGLTVWMVAYFAVPAWWLWLQLSGRAEGDG